MFWQWKMLLKFSPHPTLGGLSGSTLRLSSDNPQAYPQLLWISLRQLRGDASRTCGKRFAASAARGGSGMRIARGLRCTNLQPRKGLA
jgi:hypothetical protein